MACQHDGSNCNQGRSGLCSCPCHGMDKNELITDLLIKIKVLEAILGAADKLALEVKGLIQGDSGMDDVELAIVAYDKARSKA